MRYYRRIHQSIQLHQMLVWCRQLRHCFLAFDSMSTVYRQRFCKELRRYVPRKKVDLQRCNIGNHFYFPRPYNIRHHPCTGLSYVQLNHNFEHLYILKLTNFHLHLYILTLFVLIQHYLKYFLLLKLTLNYESFGLNYIGNH